MDPLTHSLTGGLCAKTVKAKPRRFWIMMLLGLAPDIDVIFNGLGAWAFWLHHRGITHSLFGIVLQALFYAWLLKKWDPGSFKERCFHYSLPLTFHVLGDYLTSFGVPLFAPFIFKEFSADLVVNLALIPILFMGLGLRFLKSTKLLWVTWGLYLVLCFSTKAYARKIADVPSNSFTTLPTVVNPFLWRGVEVDEKAGQYRQYKIDLFKKKAIVIQQFAMPSNEKSVLASLSSEKVKTFLKENRWPVVRSFDKKEGSQVEWGNLLFSLRGAVRKKVVVNLDKNGNITSDEKAFGFWSP